MKKPKKNMLDRKVPFNKSIKRSTILAFEKVCEDLCLNSSNVTEELLISFVQEILEKKKTTPDEICLLCGRDKFE